MAADALASVIGLDGKAAPIQQLRAAREELQRLADDRVAALLLPGVGKQPAAAAAASSEPTATAGGEAAVEELWSHLQLLVAAQSCTSARVLGAARYQAQEMAGLLQLLHAPLPHGAATGSDARRWCEERLEKQLRDEEPLALLEVIAPFLREPRCPPWLRPVCTDLLSRCVLRPGGVSGLIACLRGGASLAVQLLSSKPKNLSSATYVERMTPQLRTSG